jgi:hypothetical protein
VSDAVERPLDLRELLRTLAEHRVDYLVIGGVAAQVHGRRRTTRDLDITPAPDTENLERLAAALCALDAYPTALGSAAPAPTAEQLRIAPIVPPLSTPHGELHILNAVPGAAPYAEMAARALTTDLDGIPRIRSSTLTMLTAWDGNETKPRRDSELCERSSLDGASGVRSSGAIRAPCRPTRLRGCGTGRRSWRRSWFGATSWSCPPGRSSPATAS